MSFSQISGNENLIARLRKVLSSGRFFHGYIFEGRHDEISALADNFVKAAFCEVQNGDACDTCVSCRKINDGNSENVIRISDDNGSIKDRQIEEIISFSMKKSFSGKPMFILVDNAETMTLRAQNRLLKTLEEPPEGVVIILLTDNSESLVQTIRSRCQLIKTESDGIENVFEKADEEFKRKAVELTVKILTGKPYYDMIDYIDYFTSSKTATSSFIAAAEIFFRDIILLQYVGNESLLFYKDDIELMKRCAARCGINAVAEAVNSAEQASQDLVRSVSAGHALKYMIFEIQEKLN